jgi:trk system potassium uptake protein
MRSGLKMLLYPNSIYSVRYGKMTVDEEMLRGVFLFFSTYMLLWAVGALVMAAFGYDLATSLSASITALSNVGPGLGDIVGPAGNFATMEDPVLYLLTLLMLLGRLEVLTILVVLTPLFWRG